MIICSARSGGDLCCLPDSCKWARRGILQTSAVNDRTLFVSFVLFCAKPARASVVPGWTAHRFLLSPRNPSLPRGPPRGTSALPPVNPPRTDDERWFAEYILPHEPMLRAWLRTRFPSLYDADDLVQETYARVLHARATVPIATAKAFLFTTARNLAIDRLRRAQIVDIESLAEIERLSVFDDMPGVSETVERRQELELLTQAIQSLPERCRQVLTLRKIYGLSQREIAAQLGISEHTVEAQVGNGMRRCAEFLARHGLP